MDNIYLDDRVFEKIAGSFVKKIFKNLTSTGRGLWGGVNRVWDYGDRGWSFIKKHPVGSLSVGVPLVYNFYNLPDTFSRNGNNILSYRQYKY